jgi:hypothetical protein
MRYLLLVLLFASCKTPRQEMVEQGIKFKVIEGYYNDSFYVIEIEKCEYIVYNSTSKGGIIHKANCKNH